MAIICALDDTQASLVSLVLSYLGLIANPAEDLDDGSGRAKVLLRNTLSSSMRGVSPLSATWWRLREISTHAWCWRGGLRSFVLLELGGQG